MLIVRSLMLQAPKPARCRATCSSQVSESLHQQKTLPHNTGSQLLSHRHLSPQHVCHGR